MSIKNQELSEQELIRREKLKELQNLGIDPYPSNTYLISDTINNIRSSYKENQSFSIAGRLIHIRIIGKSAFIELQDNTDSIQIYINQKNIINDDKKIFYNKIFKKLIDIGDILGIEGNLFKTKLGEVTIRANKVILLAKCLRPFPQSKTDEKGKIHNPFINIEQRYRMRYLDLLLNKNKKKIFIIRNKIIQFIRNYFNKEGYLEVETPILQSIPGGALAQPFITHYNSLDMQCYLRISNELYLKQLIVGGFNGVYEFSRNFRNEGMDRIHNPEFTILELYVAYKDYFWMMNFIELLIKNIILKIHNTTNLIVNNKKINFYPPFKKISFFDSIKENIGVDISNMNEKELKIICQDLNININNKIGKAKLLDAIFGEKCEKKYIQPTFIIDFPIEMSPLSKKHRNQKNLTERFELIIDGKEICNAYSELNDPIDQITRFEKQVQLFKQGDNEAMCIDYGFLRALEFGMPPTAGVGIGIDRLTMLITNQSSIQEVLLFPHMKLENKLYN